MYAVPAELLLFFVPTVEEKLIKATGGEALVAVMMCPMKHNTKNILLCTILCSAKEKRWVIVE